MRAILISFLLIFSCKTHAQSQLKIIDISQLQIRVWEKYKNLDSPARSKIFIDSVYTPCHTFWDGYVGDGNAVADWMNGSIANIPQIEKKNTLVDGKKLVQQFRQVEKQMTRLTGYKPKGLWYIVYGPAWTDLGGLGDFTMLIDLSHGSNSSNDRIVKMFPHELTHQIMTNTNKYKDTTAISSIIGEGFAVWMNQKYWGSKYTLAENLGYTDAELQACNDNIEKLKPFFLQNRYSPDKEIINSFRNRGVKLNPKLPGAIGYYIGYRIIEAYVKKFGPGSWKDVFIKSAKDICELSGFAG